MALYSRNFSDETIKNWEFWRYQSIIDALRQQSQPDDSQPMR